VIEVGFLCYTLFNLLTFVIYSVDVLAGVPSPGRRDDITARPVLLTRIFGIYYCRIVASRFSGDALLGAYIGCVVCPVTFDVNRIFGLVSHWTDKR